MNELEKNVVVTLAELAILKDTTEINIPFELVRLGSALRDNQSDFLTKTLNKLRDNEQIIKDWKKKDDKIQIKLSENFPLPDRSEVDTDILADKFIRRVLLYRLYQEYRSTGELYTHYPLVNLSDILEISNQEIFRHVEFLHNEYYLEYGVADGGRCTSDLTNEGLKLCENRFDLFEEFCLIKAHEEEDVMLKMANIDLFISHSSADKEFVEALIDLLRAALNMPSDQIRCTSVDGYLLPAGATTDEQLRQEIYGAKTFIGVITKSSIKSPYVLFELGARWGAQKHLAPLLACGATARDLGGPLKSLNCLSGSSSAQIHQLIGELANELNIKIEKAASYQGKVDKLLKLSSEKSGIDIEDEKPNTPFFENDFYWITKEDGTKDGPFCQICWEKEEKLIHLNSELVDLGEDGTEHSWHCRSCSRYY